MLARRTEAGKVWDFYRVPPADTRASSTNSLSLATARIPEFPSMGVTKHSTWRGSQTSSWSEKRITSPVQCDTAFSKFLFTPPRFGFEKNLTGKGALDANALIASSVPSVEQSSL